MLEVHTVQLYCNITDRPMLQPMCPVRPTKPASLRWLAKSVFVCVIYGISQILTR